MRRTWSWGVLLAGIILPISLVGQVANPQITFERFERDSELNYSYLTNLVEDEQGFLWIGSGQSGAIRYDGLHFRAFEAQQGVFTTRLRSGPRHGLWTISMVGHLHRFQPHQEKFTAAQPHFSGQTEPIMLEDLQELRNGSLWVTTKEGQLCHFDPATGLLTPFPLALPDGSPVRVERLLEAPDRRLWVSSENHLLGLSPTDRAWALTTVHPTETINTSVLDIDARGHLWLAGMNNQVLRYDPVRQDTKRYDLTGSQPAPRTPYNIKDIFTAADGQVWISTNYNGICLLDPATGRIEHLKYDRNDPLSLSSNSAQNILQDRTGSIWVTTWGGGLNRFRPANQFFRHYRSLPNVPGTLSHPEPSCFYATADGSVWIGTRDGLNHFDPASGQIEAFFLPSSLTGAREVGIYSLAGDTSDPDWLWVATSMGLYRFNRPTGRFERWAARTENPALSTGIVYGLLRDRNDTLWAICFVGGNTGYLLYRYDSAEKAFVNVDPIPARHTDRSEIILHSIQPGTLWIDTPDSVFYEYDLADEILTPYELSPRDSTGFNTGRIGLPLRDRQGRRWFGTQGGLYQMLPPTAGEPVRFRVYTEEDGLVASMIESLLLDDQERLWIGTADGLSCFDPETEQFANFKAQDGLQDNEFSYNSAFRHPQSRALYLGGANGFNVFQPDHLPLDTIAPTVALTQIEVLREGKMVPVAAFDSTYQPISTLQLTAAEKIIRFEFAALHFADPKRNQYAYQLEGFDTEWRYSGDRPEATYTNLDPGTYRLRVKAANKDGVWNETGRSLDLRILPPWWATGWAYLLYLLTLGGGATWLYRSQQRRRRSRAEAERIKELDRFKTQFYTNITHEFRTPLTVILGMVKQVREYPDQFLRQGTELIERNGRQLLGLINQLLDLSKLDSQAFQLALRQGDIVSFLHYLTDAHQGYATTKDIALRFQTEIDYLVMDFDPEQLRQVIGNLISNALKFTPAGGEVYVGLRVSANRLEIVVRDTGIGIPADDLPYIFDRFYQVNRRHNPLGGGTGIGLAHAQELVRLMDGSIAVASTPGEQTVFTVQLPIRREAAMAQAAPAEDLSTGREAMGEYHAEKASQPQKNTLPQLLLVEDNPDVVTYLQACLRGKYACSVARNGQEGIDRALAQVPDLIISDVMMPQRDGFEVCAALKQNALTSHIPIVLLTARADAQSRLTGIRRGADVYLAKPFDAEELLAQLDRLLERQRSLAKYFSRRIRNAAPAAPPADLPAADIEIEDSFLEKIRAIVSERYSDEDFSLSELCQEIGMSRSQLFRKMKALAAISPSEYIRTFRLERARELLANSELNVSEVAWRVGYRDPSYFSKSFQDAFGYLPSSASPSASSN